MLENRIKHLAPIDVQQLPFEDIKGVSGYTVGMKIYNNLDRNVVIGTRDGFRTKIEPMNIRGVDKGIYFICEHKVSLHSTFDIDKRLNEVGNPYRENSILTNNRSTASDYLGIKSLFTLDQNLLRTTGGGYIRQLDCSISLGDRLVVQHPYSDTGFLEYIERDLREEILGGSLGIRIMVVDNNGTFGNKFINFGGLVHEVESVSNYNSKEGIYIVASSEININGQRTNGDPKYYSFQEVYEKKCPLMFFNSYQEAKDYGDIDSIRERKKKELEHVNAIETLEQQRANLQEKRKTEEIIGELELAKKTKEHGYSMSSMDRKDHYEERSHHRKDSSELWKLIPVAIGGIILLKKLFD